MHKNFDVRDIDFCTNIHFVVEITDSLFPVLKACSRSKALPFLFSLNHSWRAIHSNDICNYSRKSNWKK